MPRALALLAAVTSPSPATKPITLPSAPAGSLNLLPILLAILVVILLILLLVVRLSGRRQQTASNPELDQRIAPPSPPVSDAPATPPEREIYRPQPTPFATMAPAPAAAPYQPPAEAAAPAAAAPPEAPVPQPVPFAPMPQETPASEQPLTQPNPLPSPQEPTAEPEATSYDAPAPEYEPLVEPVAPIERVTRAAPMYEPPPESDAPPNYVPPVVSPAYPTVAVPWAAAETPSDTAAESAAGALEAAPEPADIAVDEPPSGGAPSAPAPPFVFPSSREDEPPWTPAQAQPLSMEPAPATLGDGEAQPDGSVSPGSDTGLPPVPGPDQPPIERPMHTAFPTYKPPEPEPPAAVEPEPAPAVAPVEPQMGAAEPGPAAAADAPDALEAHYVAPEPLLTDLPPTRVPIPEATMDAVGPVPIEAPLLTPQIDVAETPTESAVAEAVAEPTPAPTPGAGSLILLIEDDERIAKFYSILFEAKGYAVQNARDGVEGVDMATNLSPALILLDVMMPKMNGLMVLQTLRANPETEHTPVVVLSNYMEPPLIQRALQLGAIEYVVKSQARPEQLVNAVPSWLKGEPALH